MRKRKIAVKMKSKGKIIGAGIALLMFIALGCISAPEPTSPSTSQPTPTVIPEPTPLVTPTPIPTPISEIYEKLLIDNISHDLNGFYERGWSNLYERGEFDCSRMTTYMWDYIRNKYKVAPEIIMAPNRKHAWLALKVVYVGDTDRYLQWTIRGVKYYYIEATVPRVIKYEKDFYMGNTWYKSSVDFYTTEIYIADDPVDANTIAGRWFNEFRLTKSDLDKLNSFAPSPYP